MKSRKFIKWIKTKRKQEDRNMCKHLRDNKTIKRPTIKRTSRKRDQRKKENQFLKEY